MKDTNATPAKKEGKTINIKYSHIDFWNRPLFQQVDGKLWFYAERLPQSVEEINAITESDLLYYGTNPDNDPMGAPLKPGVLQIVR